MPDHLRADQLFALTLGPPRTSVMIFLDLPVLHDLDDDHQRGCPAPVGIEGTTQWGRGCAREKAANAAKSAGMSGGGLSFHATPLPLGVFGILGREPVVLGLRRTYENVGRKTILCLNPFFSWNLFTEEVPQQI